VSKKKRVVLIGTGGRANGYTWFLDQEQVEYVGAADPNADNRRNFLGINDLIGQVPEFDTHEEMFEAVPDIDGVVITTPNFQHAVPAVAAMKRGCVVALEKPIAASPESCRLLLQTKRECDAAVVIGFVLRFSPFYLKAKEWIDEGRIGDVVSIQADELAHIMTTSVMFRSDWRRYKKTSGGSLLEKCCHDVDLLTWLAGGVPVRVNSMAGVKTLRPRPDVPDRCDDCAITDECPYFLPPKVYASPRTIRKTDDGILYRFVHDNSACIYNNGHDVCDHQSVQIEYDNGVLAHLLMDFSCGGSACGRHLKVVGTEGVIFGKAEDRAIHLHDKRTDEVEDFNVADDGSGHGGANKTHADTFLRMMDDRAYRPMATLEAGFLSAMLCFAADRSVEEQRHVDVSGLMDEAGLKPGFEIATEG